MVGVRIRGGVRARVSLWISTGRVAVWSGGNRVDDCGSTAVVEDHACYCQIGLAAFQSLAGDNKYK
jgi:hypothetical protein